MFNTKLNAKTKKTVRVQEVKDVWVKIGDHEEPFTVYEDLKGNLYIDWDPNLNEIMPSKNPEEDIKELVEELEED